MLVFVLTVNGFESFASHLYSAVFFLFRADGNQHNLRSAAYEALMEMVKNSPKVVN